MLVGSYNEKKGRGKEGKREKKGKKKKGKKKKGKKRRKDYFPSTLSLSVHRFSLNRAIGFYILRNNTSMKDKTIKHLRF